MLGKMLGKMIFKVYLYQTNTKTYNVSNLPIKQRKTDNRQ